MANARRLVHEVPEPVPQTLLVIPRRGLPDIGRLPEYLIGHQCPSAWHAADARRLVSVMPTPVYPDTQCWPTSVTHQCVSACCRSIKVGAYWQLLLAAHVLKVEQAQILHRQHAIAVMGRTPM